MEVRILGPVEVGDVPTPISEPKERAALAALALDVGHPVSAHRLIDAVWGDDVPRSAAKTLQGLVFRLRQRLGQDTVATVNGGYALRVDPAAVDAHRFEGLVRDGRVALDAGDAERGSTSFGEALALWRGEPLDDVADSDLRSGQRARLDELRLLAVEGRAEAELSLGRHEALLPELRALVAEHPLREGLWAHLLLALYRAGRQADALRAYRQLRTNLLDELGIDPSPPLQRLEARILRQDPQLDLCAPMPANNLPLTLSSFVGRAAELDDLRTALGGHRLVTLVGPGGIGKTRLALEAAGAGVASYPDGTWWVDLQPVDDDHVADQVAAAMGVPVPRIGAATSALALYLRQRQALLIVDDCEHVVSAVVSLVLELLAAAPGLTVLATSRVPLGVPGEHRMPVGSLELPPPERARGTVAYDAIRLFLERCDDHGARHLVEHDLGSVAALCRRLDGVPLAIELAAARVPHLAPQEITARLGSSIDVLAAPDHGDPRHRTLGAALDWSYGLLDAREQRVFDRLAVFPGDFDLDAATAVASPAEDSVLGALTVLIDASVVQVSSTRPRRYRLLDTVRTYGCSHLRPAEYDGLRRRHTEHFRTLAQRAGPQVGPDSESAENVAWRHRLVAESHNLRAAVAWSLQHETRAQTLEFGRAVTWMEFMAGHYEACARTAEQLLDGADDAPPAALGWLLLHLGYAAVYLGELDRARDVTRRALELFEAAGEVAGQGWALWNLGLVADVSSGSIDDALPLYERAVQTQRWGSRPVSAARLQVLTCRQLVLADRVSDDLVDALDASERVLRASHDPDLGSADIARIEIAHARGDAAALEHASLQLLRHGPEGERVGDIAYLGLAAARRLVGDLEGARQLLVRTVYDYVDRGDVLQLGVALQSLAAVALELGRPVEAVRLWAAGTVFTPSWPHMRRLHWPDLDAARQQLGDRFDDEVAAGRRLSLEEIAALAAFDPATG